MLYTYPFFLAAKASFNISIFLLGVRSLSIEPTNAYYTVCLIEVKLAVFVFIKDFSTELQISLAISIDTFLSVKLSEKDYKIG
jgi:hypothetical protein